MLVALFATPTAAETLAVMSQNMNRLFDNVDDGRRELVIADDRFHSRIRTAAKIFGEQFGLPHIIALQEVENRNVLQQIAEEVWRRYETRYRPVLIPGQDVSGINLAYLVRYGVEIRKVEQLFRDSFLQRDGSPLFSRPPLQLQACYIDNCLTLVNLHLRSMRGLDDAAQRERVVAKRRRQAETIAVWVNRLQKSEASLSLLLLGDINALTPSDEIIDIAGILRGNPDNRRTKYPARDLLQPDLVDLSELIPRDKRYSYIYRRQKQQLDYMLVNSAFAADVESIAFSRIDYRFSDHAGLIARFRW